ncbi:ABC transporter substrate-binding protein [Prosthecomicrobium pneumaticum]|uniref:NitT/TauT family transport system substrate-binding protein n=1 Tax=Prosthecomicrobium pneumaticum TaxID=81895 RepID=A0A7W9FKA1_9HYPH|nr:ABC transporter substrate-binding protein [Prosthecomicrobium pneumaticum]MBB5752441.1 NitT/TauT family transport system substrate-binding protein [Prosthecomicrobium pneumaticum]
MTKLTRRQFGTAALALGAASLAGGRLARAADLKTFTVTEPGHSVDSLPFYVGIKKGFYEEAGLKIELVTTEGGGKHIAAVLSGDADAYIGGPEHIAFVRARGGMPLRAVVALSNRANAFLVAKTGVTIDPAASFADKIRGKKIAIGTRGGTGYSIMLYLLERDGLDPRSDVTLIEIATSAGQMAAVAAGTADVAMVSEPTIAQGIKQGVWQAPFASMPAELGLFAWTTVNLPLSLIESDPTLCKAMVDATLKSLAYVRDEPDEAKELARQEFPTLPPDDLSAILASTIANDMWQYDGAIPPEAWDKTQSIVRIAGLLKEDVPYDQVFDPRFLKG